MRDLVLSCAALLVDNALRAILLLAESDEVALTEVAARLSIGMSTAHRLLATLRNHGFSRQSAGSRRYRLGPVAASLSAFTAAEDYAAVAWSTMEELRDRTNETVHLTVLEGQHVRFVACAESRRPMRLVSRVGQRLPAHCTSAGKAHLAAMRPGLLRRLYHQEKLSGMTPTSLTSITDLERDLGISRRRGYTRNISESEEDIAALATAIHDRHGIAVAALTIAAPQSRLRLDAQETAAPSPGEIAMTALLRQAVEDIERRL